MISSICPSLCIHPPPLLSLFISYYACLLLFGAFVYAFVGVCRPLLITFFTFAFVVFSCVFLFRQSDLCNVALI